MKKIDSLSIKYIGYNEPTNEDEIELEILGLETAITAARQRIAVLRQSLRLQTLMNEATIAEDTDEKTVDETAGTEEAK